MVKKVVFIFMHIAPYFNEISVEIHTFSFKKMYLKISSGLWRPFCLGLNVLNQIVQRLWTHMVDLKGS